ncbi:MAG: SDR family oxidoreductase [Deltaproteobacteria bacterium]|nr:SDR family oxidoreductase [Deltaproteobacteria bacterium]
MTDFSRFSLEGRTAVITGGSGGIGRGCARAFAKAGANLVIASVPPEDIPPAVAEVEALGAQTIGVTVDVSNAAQVSEMVKQAMQRFGRIDILANVAGGSYSRSDHTPKFSRGPLLELSEKDFMGAFEVNVKGTFLCSKAIAPIMKSQGKGVIINIGSVSGLSSPTGEEMAAYGAAKAAVMSLTINMAHQWKPEIRVNAIAPGLINTPRVGGDVRDLSVSAQRIAVGRVGEADDIGGLALYLASDAAAFVNGTVVQAHGGY